MAEVIIGQTISKCDVPLIAFTILLTWAMVGIGHVGLWCIAFDRTHATALPRKYRKVGEKIVLIMVGLPVALVCFAMLQTGKRSMFASELWSYNNYLMGYFCACLAICPYFIFNWLVRKYLLPTPHQIKKNRRVTIDVARKLDIKLTDGKMANLFGMLPFNQSTQLAIEHVDLQFDSLPKGLEGLRIAHLSDLHLTGQIKLEYFQEVVNQTNSFEPDLILITGDLVDEATCLDWIEPVFGTLKSKFGTFFVLGNHDLRIKDQNSYFTRLTDCGLVRVGGKWHPLCINGIEIALAGNELPWFTGAEGIELMPPNEAAFKILLSHSPDQMEWAKEYQFDMMFAGHTHGGQIQFPIIGPIVAPSKFGVRYSSGAFDLDGMFLYVSRGVSGDESIRINCPPELGLFQLGCMNKSESERAVRQNAKTTKTATPQNSPEKFRR